MNEILDKLAEYVISLSEALDNEKNANDRPMLAKNLAVAAKIFALLHKHNKISSIEKLVKSEIRNHGWSYIPGPSGENIAQAWVVFTKATEIYYK